MIVLTVAGQQPCHCGVASSPLEGDESAVLRVTSTEDSRRPHVWALGLPSISRTNELPFTNGRCHDRSVARLVAGNGSPESTLGQFWCSKVKSLRKAA